MDFVHHLILSSIPKGVFKRSKKTKTKQNEYHPFYSERMIADYIRTNFKLCEFKLKQSNEILWNADLY